MLRFDSNVTNLHLCIVQIGCGGNGSYLIRDLSQMIALAPCTANYCVADPDIVEEHNLKNQLFLKEDIGSKKATSLVRRYAANYEIDLFSSKKFENEYVQNVEDIEDLFKETQQNFSVFGKKILKILIGAVDNTFSRQLMHQYFLKQTDCIWIDVGNDSVKYLNENFYAKEELKRILTNDRNLSIDNENPSTGWMGQVIVGTKCYGEIISPSFGETFPNAFDENDDNPATISCSEVTFKSPQRILTNQTSSHFVKTVLSPIMFEGVLIHSAIAYNARTGSVKTITI